MIKLKRIYEKVERDNGFRVLVDRLWPRGLNKEKAKIDLWLKDIAPSDKLRKWFGHKPERWEEFKKKYQEELKTKKDLLKQIKDLEKKHKIITLVYSAKDETKNNAVVLAERLRKSK
jgi:uncharacterized protein YeaO (DUF488 family)